MNYKWTSYVALAITAKWVAVYEKSVYCGVNVHLYL